MKLSSGLYCRSQLPPHTVWRNLQDNPGVVNLPPNTAKIISLHFFRRKNFLCKKSNLKTTMTYGHLNHVLQLQHNIWLNYEEFVSPGGRRLYWTFHKPVVNYANSVLFQSNGDIFRAIMGWSIFRLTPNEDTFRNLALKLNEDWFRTNRRSQSFHSHLMKMFSEQTGGSILRLTLNEDGFRTNRRIDPSTHT